MVNKISINDLERFNELGKLVNTNFQKLFNLGSLLASTSDYVYGYYLDNQLIGFIHIIKACETIDIVNIVVDPSYQRKGIGYSLVNYVSQLFEDVDNIILEVRESNEKAISLYKKCGFEIINIRKKYYENEDAIIMKKVLIDEKC